MSGDNRRDGTTEAQQDAEFVFKRAGDLPSHPERPTPERQLPTGTWCVTVCAATRPGQRPASRQTLRAARPTRQSTGQSAPPTAAYACLA